MDSFKPKSILEILLIQARSVLVILADKTALSMLTTINVHIECRSNTVEAQTPAWRCNFDFGAGLEARVHLAQERPKVSAQ